MQAAGYGHVIGRGRREVFDRQIWRGRRSRGRKSCSWSVCFSVSLADFEVYENPFQFGPTRTQRIWTPSSPRGHILMVWRQPRPNAFVLPRPKEGRTCEPQSSFQPGKMLDTKYVGQIQVSAADAQMETPGILLLTWGPSPTNSVAGFHGPVTIEKRATSLSLLSQEQRSSLNAKKAPSADKRPSGN